MPSWMERELLAREREYKTGLLESKKAEYEDTIKAAEDKICRLESECAQLRERVRKISSARERGVVFVLLSILSLGIYAFANSGKRLQELTVQLDKSEKTSSLEIAGLNEEIENNSAQIKLNSEEIENIRADYAERIMQVKPLEDYIINSADFTPLKNLAGIDYEKIKGVYIIRNRELDKAYVGQSKDVLKRIKDHFTGTEPKNIIFAEDYYRSKFENKEDLFEFKIEILETKDELDRREMQLITEYDAFNSGYNKTAGNT